MGCHPRMPCAQSLNPSQSLTKRDHGWFIQNTYKSQKTSLREATCVPHLVASKPEASVRKRSAWTVELCRIARPWFIWVGHASGKSGSPNGCSDCQARYFDHNALSFATVRNMACPLSCRTVNFVGWVSVWFIFINNVQHRLTRIRSCDWTSRKVVDFMCRMDIYIYIYIVTTWLVMQMHQQKLWQPLIVPALMCHIWRKHFHRFIQAAVFQGLCSPFPAPPASNHVSWQWINDQCANLFQRGAARGFPMMIAGSFYLKKNES